MTENSNSELKSADEPTTTDEPTDETPTDEEVEFRNTPENTEGEVIGKDPHGTLITGDGSAYPEVNEGTVPSPDSTPIELLAQKNTAVDNDVVTDFAHENDGEFVYLTHLDPARQADPHGVYLDDVNRRKAEVVRAAVEEREPNLEFPPPTVGTPLASAAQAGSYVNATAVVPVGVVQKPEWNDKEDLDEADL